MGAVQAAASQCVVRKDRGRGAVRGCGSSVPPHPCLCSTAGRTLGLVRRVSSRCGLWSASCHRPQPPVEAQRGADVLSVVHTECVCANGGRTWRRRGDMRRHGTRGQSRRHTHGFEGGAVCQSMAHGVRHAWANYRWKCVHRNVSHQKTPKGTQNTSAAAQKLSRHGDAPNLTGEARSGVRQFQLELMFGTVCVRKLSP